MRKYSIAVKKFEEGYTAFPPAKMLLPSVIGAYLESCAHLKQWRKILQETEKKDLKNGIAEVDDHSRCKYFLMRGWSYSNLKMYSEAITCLNNVIDNSMTNLSRETVACLGVELISAIEAIHELGFVYNDFKPDNILVGDLSII